MPSSEFLLGKSLQAFDEKGNLVYLDKVKELEACFDEFLLFVKLTNQLLATEKFNTEQNKKFSWLKTAEEGALS